MNHKFSRLKLFVLVCGILLFLGGSAAWNYAGAQTIPAAALRNADGTLNLASGASGTLDLAGWTVNLDPQLGPVLSPQVDGTWESLLWGINHNVTVMAVSGSNVYVGGLFEQTCGSANCSSGNGSVNHIVRWDGSHWQLMGKGLSAEVSALAVNGTDVYAGGAFKFACGNLACDSGNTPVNGIAKWSSDTNSWTALDKGLGSNVNALAVSGSKVYAGGAFTFACGDAFCSTQNLSVNRIAVWDGSAWSKVGEGVNGEVRTLAVLGSVLYAGGAFTQACGNASCNSGNLTVNRIARWNGSAWSGLGSGVNDTVYSVAVGAFIPVHIGGAFTHACGNAACNSGNTTVNYIARYTGGVWVAPGSGVNNIVKSIALNGSTIYAGGMFTQVCGNTACNSGNTTAPYVGVWNGSSWSPLSYGTNQYVNAVAVGSGGVYVGGAFTQACNSSLCGNSTTVNRIAKFIPAPTNTPTPTLTPTATPTATGCATLNKPLLSAPANGGSVGSLKPTLKWNAANCAATYNLVVRDAATNAKVVKKNGLTSLQFKLPAALGHGKTYKWFVKACVPGKCVKSATWKFTIK